MDSATLKNTLCHAVTRYDRKQADKAARNPRAAYNVYALAQYLARVDDVMSDIESGATPDAAIIAGFTPGPLRNACLKAIGGNASNEESPGSFQGMPVYMPASKRGGS
jgi:hypothetical protein